MAVIGRHSLDRFADKASGQWISAFAGQEKIVLGHVELTDSDKNGEIGTAQELIATFQAGQCSRAPTLVRREFPALRSRRDHARRRRAYPHAARYFRTPAQLGAESAASQMSP